ncbi:NrfD/PsrC family molybdoenzyme membrane anchor subunit [Gordonia sp. (in: high G+C Gram-positive bacteria)]|uniref:NrfD/PsrC family molybdoenzyme membrane anchor subunit n=1 Tax=Gordonia sp. (in: high G+C Gram-positive bacteria) TaxID=84139 RepID=UPI00260EB723|nr:NrfD/PsrC family molybdoenzyme membrane anchor subunit [Gordonia sp. (in: high G+C Gram-positive bacteria)]
MTHSEYDSYRPPEPPRRRRREGAKPGGRRGGGGDGAREQPMVPEAEFASYYDRPIVKPPPWENPIGAYLFLGGLAGASAMLAAGAELTGNEVLRRNSRLSALGAVSLGAVALVIDLGRPERFLNMLRTLKLSSPMSVGSWILSGFSAFAGVAAVAEVDRMTQRRLPLGPLRSLLNFVERPAGVAAGLFGPPLAAYTAVLLSDTANPTWNDAREYLPFVFVSSASLAAGGLGMITTPVADAGPARALAVLGSACELTASELMERTMDPVAAEPLHHGTPGELLKWSKRLALAGGLGALLGGRNRTIAALSGLSLLTASALTRFGILHAGLEAAKNPRYVVVPQRNRLRKRQEAGITDDSITTAG